MAPCLGMVSSLPTVIRNYLAADSPLSLIERGNLFHFKLRTWCLFFSSLNETLSRDNSLCTQQHTQFNKRVTCNKQRYRRLRAQGSSSLGKTCPFSLLKSGRNKCLPNGRNNEGILSVRKITQLWGKHWKVSSNPWELYVLNNPVFRGSQIVRGTH